MACRKATFLLIESGAHRITKDRGPPFPFGTAPPIELSIRLNMEAILGQWRGLHGFDQTPNTGMLNGHPVRKWSNTEGTAVVEAYTINGMGHGTPLKGVVKTVTGLPAPSCLMLEFHLLGISPIRGDCLRTRERRLLNRKRMPSLIRSRQSPRHANRTVSGVIEDALRTAGLLK